ncbi:hypothetical protein GTA08_BOTSDO07479 [Neofusicoccum parvum]|uniref:Uncharacterized protein n=1 Tax=Neofusicoccum parvum TaxID=310453 RepID=A0ACB5SPG3_9PEZI|nr:hypothetical protein GTA08_BOTSDO07479 [Neofusicoccum parvum]
MLLFAKTRTGEWVHCKCLHLLQPIYYPANKTVLELQQKVLAEIASQTESAATSSKPWCLYGAAPKQTREPKSYCQCGTNYATMYSVAKGGTPCPYAPTSHPSATIVFSTPAGPTTAAATSASPTATPGPDGKSTLSKKACHVDSAPNAPTMSRDKALDAIKKLCKQELNGDRNGCIQQSTSVGGGVSIWAQAWVYQDQDLLKPCSKFPFAVGAKYDDAEGFQAMCKWALQSALDDCDTKALSTEKRGGSNQANCVRYTIYSYKNSDKLENQCPWAS